MVLNRLPHVDACCHCVTDLRTATAIIATLAIVTSPVVAWAFVRHSYVIRVSCYVTTKTNQADVIDINLNNVLSFGFGANAGLTPSCLNKALSQSSSASSNTSTITFRTEGPTEALSADSNSTSSSSFITTVKYVGWIVLVADIVLVVSSVFLFKHLFKEGDTKLNGIMKWFLYSAIISVVMSFTYGILYVVTCLVAGGSFPIFEFVFVFIDLGMWIYFLLVVNTYRFKMFSTQNRTERPTPTTTARGDTS